MYIDANIVFKHRCNDTTVVQIIPEIKVNCNGNDLYTHENTNKTMQVTGIATMNESHAIFSFGKAE